MKSAAYPEARPSDLEQAVTGLLGVAVSLYSEIDTESLKRVGAAEDYLRKLGFGQLRVQTPRLRSPGSRFPFPQFRPGASVPGLGISHLPPEKIRLSLCHV